MSRHIKILGKNDVWYVRVTKEAVWHSLGGYYEAEIGYYLEPDRIEVVCGYCDSSLTSINNFIEKVFCGYQTQEELSADILKYLQDPKRGLQNFHLRVDHPFVHLLYHWLPVPIYREDFPNKSAIVMALEAKAKHLSQKRKWLRKTESIQYFLKNLRKYQMQK